LAGPKAIESQLQRVCRGLGLSSTAPEADSLLQLLPALGIDALLEPSVAVQNVRQQETDSCSYVMRKGRRGISVMPHHDGSAWQGLWVLCSDQDHKHHAAWTDQLGKHW
jgi:hypothetical protein